MSVVIMMGGRSNGVINRGIHPHQYRGYSDRLLSCLLVDLLAGTRYITRRVVVVVVGRGGGEIEMSFRKSHHVMVVSLLV